MALRRLGDDARGPVEAVAMDQSHLSVSGFSQEKSYHSAIRVDHLGQDADPTPARSTHSSSWNAGASEVGETSKQSQELLSEMRRLRLQMSELERVAGSRASQRVTAGTQQGGTEGISPREAHSNMAAAESFGAVDEISAVREMTTVSNDQRHPKATSNGLAE